MQIQILILLREQQKQRDLAIIFVTHDIGAAVEIADRVAVMYAGRIVEEASMTDILSRPRHPYTQVLLGSRPKDGLKRRRAALHSRFAAGSFPLAAGLRVRRPLPACESRLYANSTCDRTGWPASCGELSSLARTDDGRRKAGAVCLNGRPNKRGDTHAG